MNLNQEAEHPGTSLAMPADQRKPLKSRFNDPNHPANSGSLISLITGGHVPVPGIDKMLAYKRDKVGITRLVKGKSSGGSGDMPDLKKRVVKKMQKDVLYLIVVNLPTQEEIEESAAQLESFVEQAEAMGQAGVPEQAAPVEATEGAPPLPPQAR